MYFYCTFQKHPNYETETKTAISAAVNHNYNNQWILEKEKKKAKSTIMDKSPWKTFLI